MTDAWSQTPNSAGNPRWHDVTWLLEACLWFALATSVVHLGSLLWRALVLGEVVSAGIDLVWMTPASYGLLFMSIGLLGALLSFACAYTFIPIAAVFVLVTLSLLSIFLLVHQVHPYAGLVLALGIAARWSHSWRDPARRPRLRKRNIALLTVFVIAAVGVRLAPSVQGPANELPPAAPNAPNVLLIVLDAVRAKNLSLYGYERATTPHLDRWAREGLVFDYAIAPAPWTLPTHGAMFTGLSPVSLSARHTRLLDDESAPRLAEALQQRGYATAGFSGNNAYGTAEAGLGRGFLEFVAHKSPLSDVTRIAMPFQTQLWKSLIAARRPLGVLRALVRFDLTTPYFLRGEPFLTTGELAGRAVEWLDRHQGRPFFLFMNLFDAHEFWAPRDDLQRFAERPTRIDRYDAAIAYQDREVATLLDALRARRLLDNTIVVITSDHGEQFGEHGLHGHGNSLYLELLQVPLILHYPARVRAGRIGEPVSLVDLPATILALAGAGGALPGQSLVETSTAAAPSRPVLSDVEAAVSRKVIGRTRRGPMRSLIDAEWHYIRNGDGIEELYAYRRDPDEQRDLAKVSAHAGTLESMREALARMPPGYEPTPP